MAKTVKVEFEVDNSDLDKSIKKVDDLKDNARVIPSEVIVDSSDIDETEDKLDGLKDDAETISSKIEVDDKSLKSTTVSVNQLKKDAKTVSSKLDVDTSLLDGAKNDIKDIKNEAEKPVQIVFNAETGEVDILSEKTLNLRQQVKLLKEQLLSVPEGTAEWQAVNAAFNDAQDAIDRVNVKSGDLFGTLQLIPGPIGEISNTLDSGINKFKVFASLKADDLKANIKGVVGDFKEIATTIGRVTGITRVYTSINTALATSFKVTETSSKAAATGIKIFSGAIVATGVGLLVVGLGLAAQALYKFATAEDAATASAKKFNEEISKQNIYVSDEEQRLKKKLEIDTLRAKIEGKSSTDIINLRKNTEAQLVEIAKKADLDATEGLRRVSRFKDSKNEEEKKQYEEAYKNAEIAEKNLKRLINEQTISRYNDEIKEIEDGEAKTKEKRDKANANRIKDAEDVAAKTKQALIDIEKNQKDAQLTLLEDNEREVKIITDKYDTQIALAKKYGKDTTDLEKAKTKELNAVNEKYQKEILDKEKQFQNSLKSSKEAYDNAELERIKLVFGEFSNEYVEASSKIFENQKKDLDSQVAALETKKKLTNEEILLLEELKTKRIEVGNKQLQFNEEVKEAERTSRITALQDIMDELTQLNDEFEYDYSEDIKRLDKKKELLDEQMAIELSNLELTEREKNEIIKRYGKERGEIEKEITDTKRAEEEARYNIALTYANSLGEIGRLLSAAAGESKKQAKIGLLIEQAAGLASVAVNAAKNFIKDGGIKSPLAWANLAAAGVQAASIVSATVTGIKQIDSAGSSSASAGSSSKTPAFSQPSIPVPNVGQSQSQTGTLANIVNSAIQRDNSKDKPIRTYVVGSDIRTDEQLNRRIRTSARLG